MGRLLGVVFSILLKSPDQQGRTAGLRKQPATHSATAAHGSRAPNCPCSRPTLQSETASTAASHAVRCMLLLQPVLSLCAQTSHPAGVLVQSCNPCSGTCMACRAASAPTEPAVQNTSWVRILWSSSALKRGRAAGLQSCIGMPCSCCIHQADVQVEDSCWGSSSRTHRLPVGLCSMGCNLLTRDTSFVAHRFLHLRHMCSMCVPAEEGPRACALVCWQCWGQICRHRAAGPAWPSSSAPVRDQACQCMESSKRSPELLQPEGFPIRQNLAFHSP